MCLPIDIDSCLEVWVSRSSLLLCSNAHSLGLIKLCHYPLDGGIDERQECSMEILAIECVWAEPADVDRGDKRNVLQVLSKPALRCPGRVTEERPDEGGDERHDEKSSDKPVENESRPKRSEKSQKQRNIVEPLDVRKVVNLSHGNQEGGTDGSCADEKLTPLPSNAQIRSVRREGAAFVKNRWAADDTWEIEVFDLVHHRLVECLGREAGALVYVSEIDSDVGVRSRPEELEPGVRLDGLLEELLVPGRQEDLEIRCLNVVVR